MPLCPQRHCFPAKCRPVLHAAPLGRLAPWLPSCSGLYITMNGWPAPCLPFSGSTMSTSSPMATSATSMTLNSFRLPSTRSVACTRIRPSFCTTRQRLHQPSTGFDRKALLPSRNALWRWPLGGTGVPCLCDNSGTACLPCSGLRNAPLQRPVGIHQPRSAPIARRRRG